MRKAMIMTVMLAALYLPQGGAAHSEVCNTDKFGALVCGEGNNALRSFADTTSHRENSHLPGAAPRGCRVRVDVTLKGGQPVARIVSMQRVKAK